MPASTRPSTRPLILAVLSSAALVPAALLSAAVGFGAGCGGSEGEAGGLPDGGAMEGGSPDASGPGNGGSDAGEVDGAGPDGAAWDADGGSGPEADADTKPGDGGGEAGDAGALDAGTEDSGPANTNPCGLPSPVSASDVESMQPGFLPRCELSTKTCIDDCAEEHSDNPMQRGMCQFACVGEDEMPATTFEGETIACDGCLGVEQNYCIAQAGCEQLFLERLCCMLTHDCHMSSNPNACAYQFCTQEVNDFAGCVDAYAGHCLPLHTEHYEACFATE